MRFTVFTPTYNRSYTIDKLYHSLQRQTFKDFEWIVVDDGSIDDTERVFLEYLSEDNYFNIKYIRKNNGGKHRAINDGVIEASGELFFIVDSDDYLPDDSLEIIDRVERTIGLENRESFAGVCGLKGFKNGKPIGNTFDGTSLDITTLDREKHGISGDKCEVFYTEVLKKYPFPEFEGENFLTECVVWDKIAADGYKLRFFNSITMICEYLPDGLSAQGGALFEKNPVGWGTYIFQSVEFDKLRGLSKWNTYLRYYYSARRTMGIIKMAKLLHINVVVFWIRITGLRVFYRLYR